MNIVLKLSKDQLAKLVEKYASYQFISKNQYISFYAKIGGTTISVYTSGKVMFQGTDAEQLASEFGSQTSAPTIDKQQQTNIIGTDEVGNGSYFGSLVVVASFITDSDLPLLKKLGVDDSKKLNDDKIRQIAPILMEKISHKALNVLPEKYNQVIASGYNAVSIKVALHNQAICLLERHHQPDHAIIDAFTSEPNYNKYLKHEKYQPQTKVLLTTKAESQFVAVATSSVIARYLFLKGLDELSQEYGLTVPSGAGHQSDKAAALIIEKFGEAELEKLVKLHFANTEKARKLAAHSH